MLKKDSGHPIEYAAAWLGVVLALGGTVALLHFTGHPWLLASLGGSCVILFGMPDTDMAQPRSFIGGHVIATLVGLAFLRFGFSQFGGSATLWAIGATATALVAMMATGTIHSPAGANPLVLFAEGARWTFLASPLAVGLVTLFVVAWLVNNRLRARPYPLRWK
jgi:CBS-domain-containing membrane protein